VMTKRDRSMIASAMPAYLRAIWVALRALALGARRYFRRVLCAGTRAGARQGPRRGADLRFDLEIELRRPSSAANTNSRSIAWKPALPAEAAVPNLAPPLCAVPSAAARGKFAGPAIDLWLFCERHTCPRCGGTGEVVTTPCHECHGEQRVERTRKLSVDIPPA